MQSECLIVHICMRVYCQMMHQVSCSFYTYIVNSWTLLWEERDRVQSDKKNKIRRPNNEKYRNLQYKLNLDTKRSQSEKEREHTENFDSTGRELISSCLAHIHNDESEKKSSNEIFSQDLNIGEKKEVIEKKGYYKGKETLGVID